MKTLLRQQHSPTTDETQEKFLNRCFLHQKDTLPSLITMILRIHDLIQWSTPLQQSHKKQILAIDFHSTRQLVKYIYGLESTMVKLYYSILVFMTISVVSAHQSYTDECTSYFLYHFISSYPHDQWLPYTTSWPDNWHTENFHCCALRWFITIYCKLTSTSFLWQLIFVIFRCPLTCNALSLLLDNFFFSFLQVSSLNIIEVSFQKRYRAHSRIRSHHQKQKHQQLIPMTASSPIRAKQ